MCGIGGVARRSGRIDATDRAALARLLRQQVHRGPDDEGFHGDGRVLLGHSRLAVIDLSSSARQPMPNETGDVWISFNGEIYNFEELRAELKAYRHDFRSRSDFEVVLHGYETWGMEGLLPRLRGMFAFALYDARSLERRLYLVRDRFGIKPLYFAESKDRLVFASELSAIVASGTVAGNPSASALTSFLALGSVPGPETAIEDVKSLEPAHYLELRGGATRLHRYWSLPEYPDVADVPDVQDESGDDQKIAEIGRLLEESVRTRLVSDVPLGVFASGGIDSTALVALASRFSKTPVTTVSVGFDAPGLDESRYARLVAEHYGTNHREVRLDSGEFLDALPDVLNAMDSPSVDGVNSYFVSRAARLADLSVVLTGVGGDEVFLGYPHFPKLRALARWIPWLERTPRAARRQLAALARASGLRHSHGKLEYLDDLGPRSLYLLFRGLFSPSQISALVPGAAHPDLCAKLPAPLESDDPLRSAMRLEFAAYLQHQLLRDTDVMSMAHSLEARVPFLDHTLVEAVFRLPHRMKFSRRVNKPLLLRALSVRPPRAVWDRPKQGFTLPFQSWLVDHRDELIERALAPGIFDRETVVRLWDAMAEGRAHWSRPWSLVAYSAWLERLMGIRGDVARSRESTHELRPVTWSSVSA